MRRFNLSELFSTLIGAGSQRAAELGDDPNMAGAATTIRLSPEARRFYETHAAAFGGISLSAMVAMTLEGVMQATKGQGASPSEQTRRAVDLMRDRFAHLFNAHKIDVPTQVEILREYGFTLAAFRDDTALLNLLTDTVIDTVSDKFHIQRDWLLGSASQAPRIMGRWYKNPGEVCRRLITLMAAGHAPEVICLRQRDARFKDAYEHGDTVSSAPITLIIESQHVTGEGRKFSTFELWEPERWNYQKCRLYFKALILWLENASKRRSLHYRGIELPPEIFRGLLHYELLPVEALDAWGGGCIWYPDDYTDTRQAVAKEFEELELVKETYRECHLDKYLNDLDHR